MTTTLLGRVRVQSTFRPAPHVRLFVRTGLLEVFDVDVVPPDSVGHIQAVGISKGDQIDNP